MINYDYEIRKISSSFFLNYPRTQYPEIERKQNRPYTCLLLETKYDYFICVPFRTNINHKNAFFFKNSQRSLQSKSGLDYSKMIIVDKLSYIDNAPAIVDSDEYKETAVNINIIMQEVDNYIDTYVNHITGKKSLNTREYQRKYRYSTLPYFTNIIK